MSYAVAFGCLLAALGLDAIVGDPPAIWRRVPHPVVLIGRLTGWLDAVFNRPADTPAVRRVKGSVALLAVLAAAATAGMLVHCAARSLAFGAAIETVAIAVLIAQRDLALHVRSVAEALLQGGIDAGRRAVSRIVGRDPESLDEPGICRAAIESLAENLSDGVVAPAFWYLLLGLPGLFAYKALNTADSMIGHKTPRHCDFGWAAARTDDAANFPAARLSALLIAFAALLSCGSRGARRSIDAVLLSASRHRSPNAGWPEAAMAGALGIALAGPRRYGRTTVDDAWMNPEGRTAVDTTDVMRALGLFRLACVLLAGVVALLLLASLAAGV